MAEAVDVWRDTLDAGAMRDRRNGTCRRCLPSAPGDIERDVPRTRHFCPTGVPKGSARRAPEIDRAIPAGVVPGLSTRKVGEVLLALPGRPVPSATVSRVARTLDRSVAAFHRRPLKNDCKAVMPDGVVPARKTSAGDPPRWQEGDHRLPARRQREQHGTGCPPTNPAHGNIPGPDIDGPHPPRGLHARRQVAGNQDPAPDRHMTPCVTIAVLALTGVSVRVRLWRISHRGLSPGPLTGASHRGLSPGPLTGASHRGLSPGPLTGASR